MNCPNCNKEDIHVDVQAAFTPTLEAVIKNDSFKIKDCIQFMWCYSCGSGLELTKDGTLITYLEHIGKKAKIPKPINQAALKSALSNMSQEEIANLFKKEA